MNYIIIRTNIAIVLASGSPSSKTVPSLFLIDVRTSEVRRGLGFTSAIERAEFLRRINKSFNPGSIQLQGSIIIVVIRLRNKPCE